MTYSTAPTPCGSASYGEIEDYVVNIGLSVNANFTADVTSLCETNQVQFTDNSTGGATSWSWTFQGGTPTTSIEQNPLVTYNIAGNYDVTLQVSNGSTSNSTTKPAYIEVMTAPTQAGPISGDNIVGIGEVEIYNVPALDECSLYNWTLTPEDAGTMVVTMNSVEVTWSEYFTGYATLQVCGGNDCGMGPYSAGFEVMVSDYTGINTVNGAAIEIYPNPNKGQFNLTLNSAGTTTFELKLVNALGMIIFDKMVEVNGVYNENINVGNMAEGIYYLSAKNDANFMIRKVVVQK
jgi:PKD repeat protein